MKRFSNWKLAFLLSQIIALFDELDIVYFVIKRK
jgi:hypothetical protein